MDIVLQFVLTVDIRVSLRTKVVSGSSNSVCNRTSKRFLNVSTFFAAALNVFLDGRSTQSVSSAEAAARYNF